MAANRHRLGWSFAAVGVVAAAGAIALVSHRPGTTAASATSATKSTTAPGPTAAPTPFALGSATPLSGVKNAPASGPITLTFSKKVASDSPMPTLTPAISGTWSGGGTRTLVFQPTDRLIPYEHVQVTVPAGSGGVKSADGQVLASAGSDSFTVAGVSTLRLQQLLAELGYLPLAFDPTGAAATTVTTTALDTEPSVSSTVSLSAASGSFVWRFPNIPQQLASNWQAGAWNVVTQGAVMAFESDHGLGVDGEPGKLVWAALLQAVATRDSTTRPYDYLIATETDPETVYVWRDGSVIYSTLANTGVTGATTQLGTFPVYLRYASTTMTGTNPDGSHYSDPGVPFVAYFNGSDAVHGFPRASYGFPQSDGCVELPISNASIVFGMDPYGTLVTVTTGSLASELGVTTPTSGPTPTPTTTTTTVPTTTTVAPTKPTTPAHPTTTTLPPTTTTAPPTTTAVP